MAVCGARCSGTVQARQLRQRMRRGGRRLGTAAGEAVGELSSVESAIVRREIGLVERCHRDGGVGVMRLAQNFVASCPRDSPL